MIVETIRVFNYYFQFQDNHVLRRELTAVHLQLTIIDFNLPSNFSDLH